MKNLISSILFFLVIACNTAPKTVIEKKDKDSSQNYSDNLYKINEDFKNLKLLFESKEETKKLAFMKQVLTRKQYDLYVYSLEPKKDSIIKFSFSDIINGLKKNDSVFFHFRYRHPPIFNLYYYSYSSYQQMSYPLKIFILSLNRNPKYLKGKFESFKKILYANFDKEAYKAMGADEIIDELINSYTVYNSEKFQSKLSKLENINNPDSLSNFFYDPDYDTKNARFPLANYRYESWFNSFWYRRSLEGNMEVVYDILLEVKKHYEKL